MMRDAGKRRFDLVRVLALNRFSSEGIAKVFEHTAALEQARASFWSYCEPALNTTGPMASLFKSIIAWAAGYRNQRHLENVRPRPASALRSSLLQGRSMCTAGEPPTSTWWRR